MHAWRRRRLLDPGTLPRGRDTLRRPGGNKPNATRCLMAANRRLDACSSAGCGVDQQCRRIRCIANERVARPVVHPHKHTGASEHASCTYQRGSRSSAHLPWLEAASRGPRTNAWKSSTATIAGCWGSRCRLAHNRRSCAKFARRLPKPAQGTCATASTCEESTQCDGERWNSRLSPDEDTGVAELASASRASAEAETRVCGRRNANTSLARAMRAVRHQQDHRGRVTLNDPLCKGDEQR